MSYRVDPEVARDMKHYGGETANKCFNCGNCTAICALTDQSTAFPRQYIRYIQLGLTDLMKESPDPWLCYYCGDCSETCPREAEPGEMMMAARRWLTATYDWTGIGRIMYKNERMEFFFLGLVALVVLLLFIIPSNFGFSLLAASGPEALAHVNLEAFAPEHIVHIADGIMAGLLFFFLATNALRMFIWGMRGARIPLSAFITEFKEPVIHMFTQKKWRECDTNANRHWFRHLILFTGYGTMLLLVVVFLTAFQEPNTQWNWTALFGYYATVTLLWATWMMMSDRKKKKDQIHKFSHLSDWMFPMLLFLTAATGILLHFFRMVDFAIGTYVIYVIHLMIAVPMLVIEVPFGKWAHLFYRPVAIYINALRKHSVPVEATSPILQQ